MGYTEILQMVNSDPSIALNEKIEYIGGVIPRGLESKRLSHSFGVSQATTTLLDVSGKGVFLGASMGTDSTIVKAGGKMTFEFDGKKIILSYPSQSYITMNFNVNVNSTISGIEKNFTEKTIVNAGAITINFFIEFENSMKITVENFASHVSTYPIMFLCEYALYD